MRVFNDGTAPLVLSSAAVGGANADDFIAEAGGCLAPVAPSSSCVLRVRFAPQAAGARAATLEIASNDAASPLAVTLGGTAAPVLPAPQGPAGPAGPEGPGGPKGDPGAAGPLPVMTCRASVADGRTRTTCATRLLAPVPTLGGPARATLIRRGQAVARGTFTRDRQLQLVAARPVAAGTYTLRLVRGSLVRRVAVTVTS